MEKIKTFIASHLDFKVYPVTWIAIIVFLLIVPCVKFLPQTYGYENGLLENLQMVTLFAGVFLALKTKVNKKFFNFVAMVLGILILREVNCGRTLFFPVPGEVNTFYGWKDIKYGWLAHPLYGLYMTWVGLYFLINKQFVTLWQYVKNIKFPVWNVILMLVGMALGMYAEKAMHDMVAEEITELLFYVSLIGIIYLYAFHKNFSLENKSEVSENNV